MDRITKEMIETVDKAAADAKNYGIIRRYPFGRKGYSFRESYADNVWAGYIGTDIRRAKKLTVNEYLMALAFFRVYLTNGLK